jgi:hypothetical protein
MQIQEETQDTEPHPRAAGLEAAGQSRAYELLGARNLAEAWTLAEQQLARARRCGCCTSLLAHVFDRLGTDLFLDDDPEQLLQAFDESDRDRFSPRVLAAAIVTSGRPRVRLSPEEWDG